MMTTIVFLVGATAFAQNGTSNTTGNFACAIQVNKDGPGHDHAVAKIEIETENKNAINGDNVRLQLYHSNEGNHRFDSYNPMQLFNQLDFDKAQVNCAFCNEHLGYVRQGQGQIFGFKIHTHSLLHENGIYHCAICNQPLFSLEKLGSQRFANIDWLSFSAPISQDKITLNIGKASALPYCANCSSNYPRYKDEDGRFGVTFNIN